jgi:hypothetical protein
MKPHLARLVLVALVLLANTSGRERDDRSQAHPFIVDLGPMGVDGEVVSGDPHKAGAIYVIHIRELPGMIVPPHFHPEDEHVTIVQGKWELAPWRDLRPIQASPPHRGCVQLHAQANAAFRLF